MPHPRIFQLAFVSLIVCFAGCSDDGDESAGQQNPQNPDGGGQTAPDAFNGHCTTARWGNVSNACWSCMCEACADTLNACDETCTKVFECSIEKKTLVNVAADIACEIRATAAECLSDPASQGAVQPLIAFDSCLIGAMKPAGFRVCEDVCQVPYPGDVCARYPQ